MEAKELPETQGSVWLSRGVAVALAASVVAGGCAQTSLITTEPEGARVHVDGAYVGETPVTYLYRSGLPGTRTVEIEKKGYETIKNATIDKTLRVDESLALLLLAIVPYFFSARLEDEYLFPLEPLPGSR